MNEADEARRVPRAGDVWVSKRMTRMVAWVALGRVEYFQVPHYIILRKMPTAQFHRWTRTATLVSRGRNA